MPTGVYSTRFIAAQVNSAAAGVAAQYLVPVGKVAIVKSIDIYCSSAGAVYLCMKVGAANFAILSTQGIPAAGDRHWQGAQVFHAGDAINPIWVSGDFALTVSGFLLNT